MDKISWHSEFNPEKFLSRVNLEKLLEKNELFNESDVSQGNTPCILCNSKKSPGILLNDKSYLCKQCFVKVSSIKYPQRYEKARRDFLKSKESRRIALEEFTKKYSYSKEETSFNIFAWISLVLVFLNILLIAVPIVLFLIHYSGTKKQEQKLQEWEKQKSDWETSYPEPELPILRHFHDPQAQLTIRDHKILKIFNNWPGYPPFWNYLREIVLSRDGNRCQVSGCPSRVTLHVHHQNPVSQGGEHVPVNLVSLCDFHHALEPYEGHERIWGTVKTRYFTIVREHTRHNPSNPGTHNVRAHIRRLELVKLDELKKIKKHYSLSCPSCNSKDLQISVNKKVIVKCSSCSKQWSGPKELTEETGPRLAEILKINSNKGLWKPRWEMLSKRTENVFITKTYKTKISKKNNKKRTIKTINQNDKPLCPECGSPMRLIKPKKGQRWKAFWGCTKYWTNGCKGSRKV
jgi:ssDNA-binding Zn-finger/Zn-ribbon topoisomerase 1